MDKDHFRFAFVGDVCLSFMKHAPNHAPKFEHWPMIKREIGEHDFLVGNLECCLVDERCREKARRQPMATPTTAGAFLRDTGFSELCLANNHSMDCGAASLVVTREHLSSLGIRGFGAGPNLHEAEAPAFAERNGCKTAFLGAGDTSRYYAANDRSGIAPLEKSRLGERVRAAAAQADLVVVTLHADLEFVDVPGRWRQRLSRWLIEQGAHMVIQHHPHVLQGIETYKGGLIAYSLGNFIFKVRSNRYQENEHGVFDSMVLVVDADLSGAKPKLTHRAIPLRIGDDHVPYYLTGPSRDQALQRVQELSLLVARKNARRSIWFRRCRFEARNRIWHLYYTLRRDGLKRVNGELQELLTCQEDRRWMLGLASLGYL